jgi:hypothetical protein
MIPKILVCYNIIWVDMFNSIIPLSHITIEHHSHDIN